MAQQVKFVYLSEAEYNRLSPKSPNTLYFISDKKRLYRGTQLFSDSSFLTVDGNGDVTISDLTVDTLEATNITIDGEYVSLEGHKHNESDVTIDGTPIKQYIDNLISDTMQREINGIMTTQF